MRKIDKIIVHCAATPEGKDFTVQHIDGWHRQRGFRCIGYHYVIYRDGSVADLRVRSAHTALGITQTQSEFATSEAVRQTARPRKIHGQTLKRHRF